MPSNKTNRQYSAVQLPPYWLPHKMALKIPGESRIKDTGWWYLPLEILAFSLGKEILCFLSFHQRLLKHIRLPKPHTPNWTEMPLLSNQGWRFPSRRRLQASNQPHSPPSQSPSSKIRTRDRWCCVDPIKKEIFSLLPNHSKNLWGGRVFWGHLLPRRREHGPKLLTLYNVVLMSDTMDRSGPKN